MCSKTEAVDFEVVKFACFSEEKPSGKKELRNVHQLKLKKNSENLTVRLLEIPVICTEMVWAPVPQEMLKEFEEVHFEEDYRSHSRKHNRTGTWVGKKKKQEAIRLLTLAHSRREEFRRRSRESEREVKRKIKARIEENNKIKQGKEIQEREKHLTIVNEILAQGGLCTTKESVDKLMTEKNKTERLKAQLRCTGKLL
ncbi:hypothetical protein ElyMa_006334800 [Elysia marginata]|uniref:Uncharacterized protein n=1 Tax=Elysia marginata TaxID=1093978 RepID=A0AAV4HM28_9GAST|nr:hypothetical protein ElyMa_006334800 [Elysia marginata]